MVSAMKNLNKAKGISAHWEGYFRYDGQGCLLREGDIWDETWIVRTNESRRDAGKSYSSRSQWQRKDFEDKMSLAHVAGVRYTREKMLENEFGSDVHYFVSDLSCFISRSIQDWWWLEDGQEFFDIPPTEVGDLCLLLFNLGSVTLWPIKYSRSDTGPVSGFRP